MIYLNYTNLANIPWNNLEKKIGIVSDHEKDEIYTYMLNTYVLLIIKLGL